MGKAFYFYCVVGQRKAQKPNALALVVSSVMQTQLSMKPAGLVAPPEISILGLTRILAPLFVIVVFNSQPSFVFSVIGHLLTSFLWLHWVAFMLITWSQYSSVSKRKVQLNFGSPLALCSSPSSRPRVSQTAFQAFQAC